MRDCTLCKVGAGALVHMADTNPFFTELLIMVIVVAECSPLNNQLQNYFTKVWMRAIGKIYFFHTKSIPNCKVLKTKLIQKKFMSYATHWKKKKVHIILSLEMVKWWQVKEVTF